MKNSRAALITGCDGFSGGYLAKRLARESNVRIVGASLSGAPAASVQETVKLDIRSEEEVNHVVAGIRPQLVFHLAGIFAGSADELYTTNFLGTLYLLNALRRHALDARILLVGSAAEYGDVPPQDMPITEKQPCIPQTHYAASKYAVTLLGREYAHRLGMKVVITRPFNMVGAGMPAHLLGGAILQRAKQALANEGDGLVRMGNMESARDFIAAEDVADAYVKMILGEFWGEVFNLCSGRACPVSTLAHTLISFADRPLRLETDPSLVRPVDPSSVYGSFAKAKAAFGFEPVTPLEDCLKAAWKHEMEATAL